MPVREPPAPIPVPAPLEGISMPEPLELMPVPALAGPILGGFMPRFFLSCDRGEVFMKASMGVV